MSREFDFTGQRWGHALHNVRVGYRPVPRSWIARLIGREVETVAYMTCMGHSTPIPTEGDVLLVPMGSGRLGRWIVVETEWVSNVDDMFSIRRADFDGYQDERIAP